MSITPPPSFFSVLMSCKGSMEYDICTDSFNVVIKQHSPGHIRFIKVRLTADNHAALVSMIDEIIRAESV